MASGPINSRQIEGEKAETVTDFIFLSSKFTGDRDCSHEIKRCLLLGRISSVQFSHSVMSDSLRPMNHSMPGLPVHHQHPEFAQNHIHRVSDAIQPSHPLASPSPAFNLSQRQGLFHWVSSSHQVAKVLELQHQSFQWILRVYFL